MARFGSDVSVLPAVAVQLMSTGVPVEEVSGGGALLTAVGTTFVTYMTADFLSNFLQHPTQKVGIYERRHASNDVKQPPKAVLPKSCSLPGDFY